MGEDRVRGSGTVDFNARETRTFDVFRYGRKPQSLDIACATQQDLFISVQTYIVTIRVYAEGMEPAEKRFVFAPRGDETFSFYPYDEKSHVLQKVVATLTSNLSKLKPHGKSNKGVIA